jgi:hypothetical protein
MRALGRDVLLSLLLGVAVVVALECTSFGHRLCTEAPTHEEG